MPRGTGELSPSFVLAAVARAIPVEVREHLIIIGSLAAAYQLFEGDRTIGVRTKDVDCVLAPFVAAVSAGRSVAERLLAAGWQPKTTGRFSAPGNAQTPVSQLPAVRLHPPSSDDWFIELLTEPEGEAQLAPVWTPLPLASGDHYALVSFPFTGIATFDAQQTKFQLRCALPEMMVLANLLEHRDFTHAIIEDSDYRGRPQLRRNKDLGRVLAIATLTDEAAIEQWAGSWERALKQRFPERWRDLAGSAGAGLRRLLASGEDLQEATAHCANGLLSRDPATAPQLAAIGSRLITFAVEPLERLDG